MVELKSLGKNQHLIPSRIEFALEKAAELSNQDEMVIRRRLLRLLCSVVEARNKT